MNIQENETLDDLQNGYWILQPKKGFRFGIDAVLLADFADISPKDTVLDLGCGSGILPLLLAARNKGRKITGLEISEDSAAMARRSAAYNHLEDRIFVITGDLREAGSYGEAASFDTVVSNPPYMLPSQGKVSPDPQVAAARHEVLCTFADVAQAASAALKERGRFFLVHRAVREEEILKTLRENGLMPVRLRRVQPFSDADANLILIEAEKCLSAVEEQISPEKTEASNRRDLEKAAAADRHDPEKTAAADRNDAEGTIDRSSWEGMIIEAPLIVYETPGVYTEEVRRIYGIL